MRTQLMLGHLPMLIHPGDPQRAFVVGLGSGVTAGAVVQYPGAHVKVAEISKAVVHAARYFDDVNAGALDHDRVTVHLGDAKDILLLDDAKYDVVISEPSNPWIAGIAQLFTLEWYRVVAAHLEPYGVFVQWIQNYSLDDESMTRALRTIRAVFPEVTVWRFNAADTLVLASREPLRVDPARLAAKLALPSVAAQLGSIHLDTPAAVLMGQVFSTLGVDKHFDPRFPILRDGFPWLEYRAPRSLFRGDEPTLLDQLDERYRPPGKSALLVRALVHNQPLPRDAQRRLASVAAEIAAPRLAQALRVSAEWGPAGPQAALETGDVRFLDAGALQLGEVALDASTCAAVLNRMAQTLRRAVCVVCDPAPEQFVKVGNHCALRHAHDGPGIHTQQVEVLIDLGLLKEAATVARRALASHPPAPFAARLEALLAKSVKRSAEKQAPQ
jgi:hypothetical protein